MRELLRRLFHNLKLSLSRELLTELFLKLEQLRSSSIAVVPIEKVIERVVEVPTYIEKIVEKPVESTVKEVEKIVERLVRETDHKVVRERLFLKSFLN